MKWLAVDGRASIATEKRVAMDNSQQNLIAERGAQMFPTLSEIELARLKRFGTPIHFAAGAPLQRSGEAGHGLMLILSGEVEVTQGHAGKAQDHRTVQSRRNLHVISHG